MDNLIRLINHGGSVSDDEARRIFSILHPVITQAIDDQEACAVAASVIQRMEHTSHLAALLDWWLVVTTGNSPAAGLAYALPDSLPSSLVEQMAATLSLSTSTPIASWLFHQAELERCMAELESRLQLDHYGKSKLPNEWEVWASVLADLEPTIDALKSNEAAPFPSLSSSHLEKNLKAGGIAVNSRRWKEMTKRTDQLEKFLRSCVEHQHVVEPWIPRTPPQRIDLSAEPISYAPTSLEARLLQPIALQPPTENADVISTVIAEIKRVADDNDAAELTAIARITDSWYRTVSDGLANSDRIPAYDQAVTKLHLIESAMAELQQDGADITAAELALLDNDLDAASQHLDNIRSEQRHSQAQRVLTETLNSQRDRVTQLGIHQSVGDVLKQIEIEIEAGDIAAAKASLSELDRRIDAETRSGALGRLERLATDLERLSGERDDIDDVQQMIADTEHGGRIDSALLDRLEQTMAELIQQRLDEATDDLAMAQASLTEVPHVDATTRLTWDTTLQELTDQRSALGDPPHLDDLLVFAEDTAQILREIDQHRVIRWAASMGEEPLIEHVVEYCTQQMAFSVTDIKRFYVALKTKPFAILAGLTGSGKSTIVRLFAESVGATSANRGFRRVAVRPDWIDQSEVLGYINPITGMFQPGWLARVMSECNASPNRIFVVLLDELNLAPVEQYLAEYLSAGEEARSGSDDVRVPLYPEGSNVSNAEEWPSDIAFPENLIVVGTVNMDETTRVLSDRVLDRANVLQLDVGISDDHHQSRTIAVSPWDVPYTEWRRVCRREPAADHHELLVDVADLMRTGMRIGLGVRAHIEIERFVANALGVIDPTEALDVAMLQRVIPKIKGFKRDLIDGLEDLNELLSEVGAQRCARVIDDWLDSSVPDDDYLDGTSHRIGFVG